jgi:tetratricopeptide (TPR) repeat protein
MLADFPKKRELLNAASDGRLVLFLGAGVNVGCEMGNPPMPAPLGQQLAEGLSLQFFPDEQYRGESLRAVCTKIQNIEGKQKLREALIQRLSPAKPSQALLHIPQMEWESIYSVNIDDVLETAYSTARQRVQNLIPIVLYSDVSVSDAETEVPYYKLHGCIAKPESNLVFSHRDYTQAREKNLWLFAHLSVTLCESPLLFVGFGFEDSDFQDLWQSVKDYGGATARLQASYLVKPNASPSFTKSMEVEGVTVIDTDAATFFPWLKANLIKRPISVTDKVIERGSAVTGWATQKFGVSLPPELADAVRTYCNIVSELPPPVRMPERSRFLLGANPYWDDIQNGVPIKREIEEELIEDINSWIKTKKSRINVLLGAAGYGKTTVLMQTAYDQSKNHELVVLWVRPNTSFDPTPIADLCAYIKHPTVLFVDDASRHMSSIKRLYLDAVQNKLNLYILAASRPNEWNSARGPGSISIQSPLRLPRLTENEALALAQVIKRSGLLEDKATNLQVEEICKSLLEIGEKHIIAGLRTVMAGNETKYHEIIADEYFRIPQDTARRIYLTVAVAHSLGLPMPASLATRLADFPLTEYHSKVALFLDEVVLEDLDRHRRDLLFYTQHRVIAESLLESVIDPASTVQLLFDITKYINPHSDDEYAILRKIYDEDYLERALKESGRIRSLYEYFMQEFPSDPYIKQHAAIFESKERNFVRARELADEAIEHGGRHPHFLNTKGTIWLREAVAEPEADRAEYALKKGISLIRERISKDSDKEIHYHSLIDKLLDWAIKKDHLSEEQRLRVLEEAQEDLDNALRLYPTSSDLSTLSGRLNIALERIPEAEEKLKRSLFLDAGNVRARLLLTGMLMKRGNCSEALKHIDEGLAYASDSAGLHRMRVHCLHELGSSWSIIKAAYKDYLRISTTDYMCRLKLIKFMIERGEYIEASKEVQKMRDSALPFSAKVNLTIRLQSTDGKPLTVTGKYKPYRLGKGFIEINGFPQNLNAHMDLRVIRSGRAPHSDQNLKVEIAVNGLGIFVTRIVEMD